MLLAAQYWDYGQRQRGLSFEYHNLYLSLKAMFDTQLFDFSTACQERGRVQMNQELLALVRSLRPDLAIFALFGDEFIPEVIEDLKQYTTTVGYFFDDDWRIDFARRWVPRFDYVMSKSTQCLRRYKEWGYTKAIFSPCGFNHRLYGRRALPKRYDVSFVGGSHPHRQWIISQLRRAGLDVHVWGGGAWGSGVRKLTHEEMVDVFNQSRVNLNLSNSVSWDVRYLTSSLRAIRNAIQSRKTREQLKARHFELCGCGGFQLTYYVEDLEHCYDIGREIMTYMDVDDLIEKIRYYLKHEDEREAIAEAGYRRALADHTYERRFSDLVTHIFGDGSRSPTLAATAPGNGS